MRILQRLQTHTIDKFLFISHTTNVLLLKFCCSIFIGVRIIKEIPGSVASGTPYIFECTNVKYLIDILFLPHCTTAPVGQDLLNIEASRSHSDTPHSVGLLWTSDQLDVLTNTTLTGIHPCPQRTRDTRKQASADQRLRRRGHCYRHAGRLSAPKFETQRTALTFWRPNNFFLILAHSVYKV